MEISRANLFQMPCTIAWQSKTLHQLRCQSRWVVRDIHSAQTVTRQSTRDLRADFCGERLLSRLPASGRSIRKAVNPQAAHRRLLACVRLPLFLPTGSRLDLSI